MSDVAIEANKKIYYKIAGETVIDEVTHGKYNGDNASFVQHRHRRQSSLSHDGIRCKIDGYIFQLSAYTQMTLQFGKYKANMVKKITEVHDVIVNALGI